MILLLQTMNAITCYNYDFVGFKLKSYIGVKVVIEI